MYHYDIVLLLSRPIWNEDLAILFYVALVELFVNPYTGSVGFAYFAVSVNDVGEMARSS